MEPAAEGDAEMLGTPDPELAATMGFSGFGKKARTFDLEAMFEQTRRTAVERSRKVLEAREREKEDQTEKEFRIPCTDSSASASSATRAGPTLPEREVVYSESEDNSNEALSGPSMQSQSSAKGPTEDTDDDDDDDDEEFIGPPLPPGFKDSDDDNDNDDTEEEDNNSLDRIFCGIGFCVMVSMCNNSDRSPVKTALLTAGLNHLLTEKDLHVLLHKHKPNSKKLLNFQVS